jgi:hypothetical protein
MYALRRSLAIIMTPIVLLATFLVGVDPSGVGASSHREAPLIASDPDADNTDVYAFVSPDDPNSVTLIANYIPLEWPEAGPNFHQFSDNVLYEINVDNIGDAKAHITYQFRFTTITRNPATFLYNTGTINSLTDEDWNVYQRYSVTQVTRVNGAAPVSVELASGLRTPPVNIGPKSTPNYDALAQMAIHSIGTGGSIKVFAGQRDDPFFVDLGSVFDLLSLRGQAPPVGYAPEQGKNIPQDGVAGYNTHAIAIKVPTVALLAPGRNDPVIGVWATASRRTQRVLNGVGGILDGRGAETHSGDFVQVSRLGMPLVNEAVIPRALKDAFNNLKPEQDLDVFTGAGGIPDSVRDLFQKSVLDPELQRLLKALYNVPNPGTNRQDIFQIFLTGMKLTRPFTIQTKNGPAMLPAGFNVNQPRGAGNNGVRPAEMLRLNTAIKGDLCKPVPDYQLGLLGGDACGFPNGRRLQDDVTDIELLAVAGAAYNVLAPANQPTFSFNTALLSVLRDNVSANDLPLRATFPYAATPHQGKEHRHANVYSSFLTTILVGRQPGLQNE